MLRGWNFFQREAKVCAPGERLRVTDGLREIVHLHHHQTYSCTLSEKDAVAAEIDFLQEGRYLWSVKVSVRVQIRSFERGLLTGHLFKGKKNSIEGTLDFC